MELKVFIEVALKELLGARFCCDLGVLPLLANSAPAVAQHVMVMPVFVVFALQLLAGFCPVTKAGEVIDIAVAS
jgi:hypothetical protein